MLIWKGYGFLVGVITFLSSLVAQLICEYYTKDETYYTSHNAPLAYALVAAGIINGFLGNSLNNRKTKTYIDKETREEIVIKNDNSFFFIPMEYWSIILIIAAFLVLIYYKK